jgi:hypothetical protein
MGQRGRLAKISAHQGGDCLLKFAGGRQVGVWDSITNSLGIIWIRAAWVDRSRASSPAGTPTGGQGISYFLAAAAFGPRRG